MKKLLLLAALLPFSAQAEMPSNQTMENCAFYGQMSAQIMTSRQLGMPMLDVLDLIKRNQELFYPVVRLAYTHHRWETDSMQQKEIDDFHSEMYALCLDNAK